MTSSKCDLACVTTRGCSSLHKQQFFVLQKDTLRQESSINMTIFITLKDLHAELQRLTMLDFFLSVTNMTIFITLKDLHAELPRQTMLDFSLSDTSMIRFGTHPAIQMQSTNMVEVRTTVTGMQKYYKACDPKSFIFPEERSRKFVSVNGH